MSILASDKIQDYFPQDSQTLNLYNDYISEKSVHFSHWNTLQDKMVRMYDAYEAALATDVPEFSFGTTLTDLESSIGRFKSLATTLSAGSGKQTVGTVFIEDLTSQVETIKTDLAVVIKKLENEDKAEDNVLTKIERLNQELTIKETQKYKFSINLYTQNAPAFKTMEEMFESSTNKKLKLSINKAGGVKNYVETKYETMIQSLQTKIKELDLEFRKKIEQNRDVLLPKLLVEIDVTEQKNEAKYSFVPMYHGFVVKHEGTDYICKRVDIDEYDDVKDSDPEQSLASKLLKTNDSETLRLLVLPRFSFIRNADKSNLFPIVCEEYYLTTFGLMYSEKFSPSPDNGFETRLFFKVCEDLFNKAGQALLNDIQNLEATMKKVSIQINNFKTFYTKQKENLGTEETIKLQYSKDVLAGFGKQVSWENPYYEPITKKYKDYLDEKIEKAKQQINAISELGSLNSSLEGLHDQLNSMVSNANDMIKDFSENGLPKLLTLFTETTNSISSPLDYLSWAGAGDIILSDQAIAKNALKSVSEIMGKSNLPGPKVMSYYEVEGHKEYEVIAKNMIFYAGNFYTTFEDAGTVGTKKDVTAKHSPFVTPATLIPTDNKIDQISLAKEIIYKNLNGPIHLMNLMLSNNDILRFLSADKKEFKERSIQFKNKQNVNDEENKYMLPYNTALDMYGLDKLTGSKSLHISQIFMALQLFMSKSIYNDYRLLISAPPGFGKSNIYYYTLRSLYERFSKNVHTVYVFCTSATVENQYKQCIFSPAFLDLTLNNVNPYEPTFQKFNFNGAADINPNLLENKSILETIKLISKDKGVVGTDGCYGNKNPELESVMTPYYDYIKSFKQIVTDWMKSLFKETIPNSKQKQYKEKVEAILEKSRTEVKEQLEDVFGKVSASFDEKNKLELKHGKNKVLQKLVKIASLDQLKYMLYTPETATIYKLMGIVIDGFVDLYFKICDEDEKYDVLDLIKKEKFKTTELPKLQDVFKSMNKEMEKKKGKGILELNFKTVEDCKAQRDVFEQMTRTRDVEIKKEVSQGFKICFLHYDSCLALPNSEIYKHIQEGVQKDEDGQDSKISLIFDEVDYLFENTNNDSQKTKDIKESLKNLLLENYQFSYVLGLSATIGSGPENMYEVLKGFRKKDLNMELFRNIWNQDDSEDNRKKNVYSLALNYANVGVMHLDNPTLINLLEIPPVFKNIKFDEHTKCTGKNLPGIFCVDTTPKGEDAADFKEADPAGKLKICQDEASINVPGKVIELMLALRSGKFSDPDCNSFNSNISSVIFASSNTFARQMAIAATKGKKFSIQEVKIKNNKPDTPLHYRGDDVEIFYLSELIEYKDETDLYLKEFTTAKCDKKLRMCFVSPFWARGVDFHNCQFVFKVNSPTDIFEDIQLDNPNTGKCINVETSLQMDGRIRRRFSHAKTDALRKVSNCETRCEGVGSYWILPTTPSEVYTLDDAYKMLTTVIDTAEKYHSITQSMTEASPCAAILYQLVVSDDRYLKALQRALIYVGSIEGSNLPSPEQIKIYFAEYKKKSDLIAFRSEDIVVPENIYLNSEQSDILKSLLSFMSA